MIEGLLDQLSWKPENYYNSTNFLHKIAMMHSFYSHQSKKIKEYHFYLIACGSALTIPSLNCLQRLLNPIAVLSSSPNYLLLLLSINTRYCACNGNFTLTQPTFFLLRYSILCRQGNEIMHIQHFLYAYIYIFIYLYIYLCKRNLLAHLVFFFQNCISNYYKSIHAI